MGNDIDCSYKLPTTIIIKNVIHNSIVTHHEDIKTVHCHFTSMTKRKKNREEREGINQGSKGIRQIDKLMNIPNEDTQNYPLSVVFN